MRGCCEKLARALLALWNERRPECAHQLTGETKGWKVASRRAPTRLHRCAVCDKRLHTGPSRRLPCWKAAGYSSQNDPLYIANYGGLVGDLRSSWIATKMEHYQERRASRARRDNLAACLPLEWIERCQGGKSEFLLSWKVGSMARHSKEFFFSRTPAPRRTSSGR